MGFGSDVSREDRIEEGYDILVGELRDIEVLHEEYVLRLKNAIGNLEAAARKAEQGYGGGGYDPSESQRLAGKIEGVKLALSYWQEMNRG